MTTMLNVGVCILPRSVATSISKIMAADLSIVELVAEVNDT